MNIIAINSTRIWGGAEVWFSQFCSGMAERGHDVTLVCHPDSELRRRLSEERRVQLAPIAIRAELNYLRAVQLARWFRALQPDVVVAHRPKDVKLSATALWLAAPTPLVHAKLYGEMLKDRLDYRLVWQKSVSAMAVPSYENLDRLKADAPWLDRMPVVVIQNGADTNRYRPLPEERERVRREFDIADDVFVVSCHGRLAAPKRVDLVIQAVAAAAREDPVYGLIIGDGPESPGLQELARELDAPVSFTGHRDDIPELLAAADAEITMSEIEGAPLAVIEAMACGLPVIASNATSHPEVVEDGQSGILVEPGQAEGAAKAIVDLAQDPARRAELGNAARARAIEHFSSDAMLDRYESFLEEIVLRLTVGG